MAGDALALALREPTLGIVECESGARQALVHVREKSSVSTHTGFPLGPSSTPSTK
jgi:hypothetical protein